VPWYKTITKEQWRVLFAAQMGWTLDAMDVLLYVVALSTIIKEWHMSTSTAGLLASITLFSSAIGGAFFGIVADYIGRVRALTATILIYSLFTGMCGLTQNVYQLGVARFFLGIGMGGEWASGEVLVAETWPKEHRGKAIGIVQAGWAIGYILAAILAAVVLPRFGWRVLFFMGMLPSLFVFYIRKNVKESSLWRKETGGGAKKEIFKLWEIFQRKNLKFTLLAALMCSLCMMSYWGFFTWLPTFLSSPIEKGGAGLTIVKTSVWLVPMQLGALAGYITFGVLSDRLGRRPVFFGYLMIVGILIPIFGQTRDSTTLLLLGPLVGFFGTGYFAGYGALLSELFPTHIRATAQGSIYNFGRGVASTAPFVVGSIATTMGFGFAIGTVSIFTVAAAVTVLFLPETKAKALA
jgi:MFS family permease